jgi:hypothetical protein
VEAGKEENGERPPPRARKRIKPLAKKEKKRKEKKSSKDKTNAPMTRPGPNVENGLLGAPLGGEGALDEFCGGVEPV